MGRGTVVPMRFNSTSCFPARNRRQIPLRQASDHTHPGLRQSLEADNMISATYFGIWYAKNKLVKRVR
jgi:hypothetical protein